MGAICAGLFIAVKEELRIRKFFDYFVPALDLQKRFAHKQTYGRDERSKSSMH
jgi:hypothetical protein